MVLLTRIGILVCISQSAVFPGMNLALFSISRLRLEVEADPGPLGNIWILIKFFLALIVMVTV